MFSNNSWDTEDRPVGRKPWALLFISGIFMAVLILRLFQLQVVQWRLYVEVSNDKRLKRQVIEAGRGYIYDRNGIVLAENRMSYSITIDPIEREKFDRTIPRLASFLGEDVQKLTGTVNTITSKYRNPQKLVRDADFRLASVIEEHNRELAGVECVFDQRRNYPLGELACHVLGYMGELTPEEHQKLRDTGYYFGQAIGRYGVEKYYEGTLKGKNGFKFEERNYLNRTLGISNEYKPDPPVPGENVNLTLDVRLQVAAEEAFGDSILGSLVALDPRNGEILVMCSSPSFDPNEFASVMSETRSRELWNNPDKPMFNRAIQATYPPGSTFKMLTAISGLESGLSERTTFSPCNGVYYFGRPYHCYQGRKHGTLDMIGAITQSCNIYFYQLGRKVGIERWETTGKLLGMGQVTGIDLGGEVTGILPGLDYYERTGVDYSPGMMLNLAIGQGEVVVTVLQLARYAGIIASKGLKTTPHLNRSQYEKAAQIIEISPHSFDVVREGMRGVVNSESGTAKSVRIPGHVIAGKTGTAQNPHGADHKVFLAFAPFDDPTIAIACVAENTGNYTGSMAIRIVKRVLEEYFIYYPDRTAVENVKAD
ncbi:penicillin-binding protein 2 [bacterium]|nr:penicillin-binding protein 2 [bacterium]